MTMIDTIRNDPRRRNLAILAIAAVLSTLFAILALWIEARETARHYQPETMFPELAHHAGDVTHIHIASKNGIVDLALNPSKGWTITNHDGYPAAYDQVHQTVVGIAALLTVEPKTARADWLHYLGLDAPPRGDGVEYTLSDEKGDTLASLIVGKTTDIGDPSGAVGLYVRKPDSDQSWLARSVVEPKSNIGDWFDKNVLSVDRTRIQETDVDPAGSASYSVRREKQDDPSFLLTELPKGREPAEGAAEGIGAAIVSFTFDDVRPAKDFDFSDPSHTTRVVTKTFDGLTVTVQVVQVGKDYWATISAEGGKPDAQKEAREIDAHAFGWAYKLPPYKGQQFMTTLDSLLKPLGGTTPAQPAPAQLAPGQ
jgi:hypothetical protein